MTKPELLPCPFCGGKAKSVYIGTKFYGWHVFCMNCGAKTQQCNTEAEAFTAWNTRPVPAQTTAKTLEGKEVTGWYVEHSGRHFIINDRIQLLETCDTEDMLWQLNYIIEVDPSTLKRASEWIKVSERLPEELTLVLACILRADGNKMLGLRQRKGGNNGNEWYNERGESTMNMRQEEENVTDYILIPILPPLPSQEVG